MSSMKNYIQSLIKKDGEKAAGKIAEDMKRFVEWLEVNYYMIPPISDLDNCFEDFQDEVLNK